MKTYNQDPNRIPSPDPRKRTRPKYGRPLQPGTQWQPPPRYVSRRRRRRFPIGGCLLVLAPVIILGLVMGVYLLFPMRHNILLLGIDYADPGSYVARTDTIILTAVEPSEPYVGLLSIPRDLWVLIPGVGENRINTAHFFAEAQIPGSGPDAAKQTVELNFGVQVDHYMRVRFEGFRDVVEALGGVVIELPEPRAGYPAGTVYLTPNKALAFVRHRATSDDFQRMSNGQLMMRALLKNMLYPRNWLRLPAVIEAFSNAIDTDIPKWLWPRLALTMLRVGPQGVDSRVIGRDMVTPFTTNQGASVLAPNWPLINVVLIEMFNR